MTKREAYKLSLKKWQYIVKNDGDDSDLLFCYPELRNIRAACGYCQKYLMLLNCKGCPLNIINNGFYEAGCHQAGHPYNDWIEDPTKENAQKVLDLIIKTKPK